MIDKSKPSGKRLLVSMTLSEHALRMLNENPEVRDAFQIELVGEAVKLFEKYFSECAETRVKFENFYPN